MMICFRGHRKGQYFSFDAIVASVIFVLTLVMLLSYWHSVRTYLDYQANDLNKEAARVSAALFSPPVGDCGQNTLQRLGLANSWSDKRMNGTLLACAKNKLTPDALRTALGSSYGVTIVIDDLYTPAGNDYVLGLDPADIPPASTEVSKLRRVGPINTPAGDHIGIMDIYVYR